MKYKIIIDPNTNTLVNTTNNKTYQIGSGDYSNFLHSKKYFTPCGECKIIEKKPNNGNQYYPIFIRLNFAKLPSVKNEGVSKCPYAIHGLGKGLFRKKRFENEVIKFSGYVTRGCVTLKDEDIYEIYDLLEVGGIVYIKNYEHPQIGKYVQKYSKQVKN